MKTLRLTTAEVRVLHELFESVGEGWFQNTGMDVDDMERDKILSKIWVKVAPLADKDPPIITPAESFPIPMKTARTIFNILDNLDTDYFEQADPHAGFLEDMEWHDVHNRLMSFFAGTPPLSKGSNH